MQEVYGEISNRGYAYAYANRRRHTLQLIREVLPTGARILATVDFKTNHFNLFVVAISVGFGMIPLVAPNFFKNLPHDLQPLLESGILLCALVAVVLWIAATHAVQAWNCAPRLVIRAPERRCGKSRLLAEFRQVGHGRVTRLAREPVAVREHGDRRGGLRR